MTSLQALAIRGTAWTFVGYGASQALRFVSNLVLTHLLAPDLFGLMALVNTFVLGLNLFSDIGIGPSVIQNKRGEEPAFLNTAWTIQVIRGFGLWLCCFAIAPPIANFYNNPQLLWLIPLIGFTTAIQGFNSVNLFTLNRRIALGKLTIFEFGSQVIALAVTLIWAWLSPTIWALIAGTIVSTLARMIWSHYLEPERRSQFAWDKTAIKELFSFGRWIFLSTIMTFLASQSDRLILGKIFSLEMLGIYTIAYTLSDIPRQVIDRISSKVMFPVMAQRANLPRAELRAKILQKRWLILMALAVGVTILAGFGDFLILSLYDARYEQAAWMLPILAIGLWPRLLSITINPVLYAIGNPRHVAYGNLLKFLYMLIGLPLGFSYFGILGAVTVIALNDLPFYLLVSYGLWREKLTCFVQDIKATLLLVACLALVIAGRAILELGLPIEGLF